MTGLLLASVLVATSAPLSANLSLAAMVLAAILLTVGAWLAVGKRYEAHRWVQTGAVCLNAVPVLAWMIRAFVRWVLPGLGANIGKTPYAVTTLHAVVGAIGVVLGVFVMLRGNELVPKRLRFTGYKPWMRASYALYVLGTLTGVITYLVVYVFGWT